ncbi:YueI family protein [Lacticaseibacillus mingshuiensis]|uniref:DUF1694 domain-containing protein n=1 Tax=Lacticaseibacillus mingshuiensis TaxID=2799574 RepID=A0ABW4CK71_9LACO|nr:YueI family protein [Lacticaseibacillus mingshuiensis]
MADDQNQMQDHLNSALYGPPQTKPDERRHYLGSLRERTALFVDNQTLREPTTLAQVQPLLKQYAAQANFKLLLNGKLPAELTAPYMTEATQLGLPFTLVSDETAQPEETACGLLITSDEAIDHADIFLPKQAAQAPKDKPSLFDRLFGEH